MKFKMVHENYNVSDLDAALRFYEKALGLTEKRRKVAADGSFIIVFIGNEENRFEMELTWLRDHPQKYNIGEEEFHLAFHTDDYEGAHRLHEEMGCICFENPAMGIYFIKDPDGYWLEIIPEKREDAQEDISQKQNELLCPVCGEYSFREEGAYEICPVCGWEDDPLQRRDSDFEGGANSLSLNEAKRRYEENKTNEEGME